MRLARLHLHLLTTDLDSTCLKNKKHWNSFTTDFLRPPALWARELQATSRIAINSSAEEAKLKAEMRCPVLGVPLKNMPAVKQHVCSPSYKQAALDRAAGADVLRAEWPCRE